MSDAAPITACAWMGDYPGGGTSRILISGEGVPPEVWVCFQPKTPKISLEPWQEGRAYYFNDRVLHNGDTWRCVNAQHAGEPGGYRYTLAVFRVKKSRKQYIICRHRLHPL